MGRLLEEKRIDIEGISGTSAMNAVALARGLASGGRQTARELRAGFWTKVSKAVRRSPPIDLSRRKCYPFASASIGMRG